MNKIVVYLLLSGLLWASPAWYHELETSSSNEYIGYGQGHSEVEAKKRALDDIASQISVTIDNSLLQETAVDNDRVHQKVLKRSQQDSFASLHGYKILKEAEINGVFYIAVAYENIPSIDKFKAALSRYGVHDSETQNCYLKQTSIAKELGRKVDFSLLRKDKLWYLKYKNLLQVLDPRDFDRLFVSVSSDTLSIETNSKRSWLYEGETFFFKIHSKKSGYLTVFDVYEDGTVSTLMRHIPIQKDQTIRIPDTASAQEFEAGLIKEGVATFDLYVVVLNEEKHIFDDFAPADETLIEQERYKNFDRLISVLNDHEFSTLKLVTKPKQSH